MVPITIVRFVPMLLIWVRFILRDEKSVENIGNLLTYFTFSTICDKGFHGTTLVNVVRQCVGKLLEILDTIYITNQTVISTEDLGNGVPSQIAGVSLMRVSVATGSLQWGILVTGLWIHKLFL